MKAIQSGKLPLTPLQLFVVVVIAIGIFFRFAYLDRKIYWLDETHTSLWISGHGWHDLINNLFTGQVIGVDALLHYQRPNPDRGLLDTVQALAEDFPEHPPLYYGLLRLWMQLFGSSIATTRAFSAVISLLTFPSLYWLCLELFGSVLVAWIAMALVAVSPIHVLYAQEARQYCLWIVMTLLSSAALLRANRVKTRASWAIYAVTVALSLYTYLFAALVILGHGMHLVLMSGWRFSRTIAAYLLASVAGVLAFSPWLWIIVSRSNTSNRSMQAWMGSVSVTGWAKRWVGFLSRIFFDVGLDSATASGSHLLPLLPIPLLLGLIGYSIYVLCRRTPVSVWLFVVLLIGTIPLLLGLQDARSGGVLSSTARYLFPCFLGVQLAVAYWFAHQIGSSSGSRQLGQTLFVVVLSAGIFSCTLSSQAPIWWNKGAVLTQQYSVIAEMLNQGPRPLLVANEDTQPAILTLSHLVQPKVQFQLVHSPNIPKIPSGFSDVFVYQLPDDALNNITSVQGYSMEPVSNIEELWRLTRSPAKPTQ